MSTWTDELKKIRIFEKKLMIKGQRGERLRGEGKVIFRPQWQLVYPRDEQSMCAVRVFVCFIRIIMHRLHSGAAVIVTRKDLIP